MRVTSQHSGSLFGAGVAMGAILFAMGWAAWWVYENVAAVAGAIAWLQGLIFPALGVLYLILIIIVTTMLMIYGPRRMR